MQRGRFAIRGGELRIGNDGAQSHVFLRRQLLHQHVKARFALPRRLQHLDDLVHVRRREVVGVSEYAGLIKCDDRGGVFADKVHASGVALLAEALNLALHADRLGDHGVGALLCGIVHLGLLLSQLAQAVLLVGHLRIELLIELLRG